ncbi:hypothetical protein [Aminobacter sp. MET-1]|uniref:hypothetical protein n=1 Tax=Aminobacter sp. MET-1 TaxID=2951085 RepID=UPI002269990D|nr:hypothetical protein [Aminobacter sp. MET-1]MCX8570771.1 hypothetical protein [Aminobacter sp. MET-1]
MLGQLTAKSFSLFIDPGGRIRMTRRADGATEHGCSQNSAQKVQAGNVLGKGRHYPLLDIMPCHFLQTAEMPDVGKPPMRAIFDDLAAHAMRPPVSFISSLPPAPCRFGSLNRDAR